MVQPEPWPPDPSPFPTVDTVDICAIGKGCTDVPWHAFVVLSDCSFRSDLSMFGVSGYCLYFSKRGWEGGCKEFKGPLALLVCAAGSAEQSDDGGRTDRSPAPLHFLYLSSR